MHQAIKELKEYERQLGKGWIVPNYDYHLHLIELAEKAHKRKKRLKRKRRRQADDGQA